MPRKEPEGTARDTLAEGLAIQGRILSALMVRDMMMRYGRANIGFLWVVLEPMILTLGVMGVWSLLKSPYEHGIQIISIVLTGYMPLTLWRHITGSGNFAFRRSIGLLYHRKISMLDVVFGRLLLELIGTTTALLVVYCVLYLSGIVAPVADVGLMIAAWTILALLSTGVALVFAAGTEYSETVDRFVQPFQYLILPISGAFFMIEWLPQRGRDAIWYSPTVHCYEMFRAGFFGEGVPTHFTWWYPMVWAIALIALGLQMADGVRDHLHTG